MEQPRLLNLKVLVLLIPVILSFFWFWIELNRALDVSIVDPQISQIILLLVPIIPLILGLIFLAMQGILQNSPLWSKWLTITLISLPIFFISFPPNFIAVTATLLMFFGSWWFFERNKSETEDHLQLKIWHLSFSGGIATHLYIIIMVISLLAVANAGPEIKRNGIILPPSWFEPGSPLINMVNKFYQTDIEGLTNPKNKNQLTPTEINYLAKQLKVDYQQDDDFLDLFRKKIEITLNSILKGSANLILFLYGLTIFMVLSIVTLPLKIIYALSLCLIFSILKSLNFIKIQERAVDAQQPFYN